MNIVSIRPQEQQQKKKRNSRNEDKGKCETDGERKPQKDKCVPIQCNTAE